MVLHTDQGGEFSGGNLTRVCAAAGIVQSMGRTGSALDNAACESYHSTLEFELLSRTRFATRAQARPAVIAWIEEYNTERFHSANGMITPVDYEHGQRRPGARTYDQLRRRHRHSTKSKSKSKTEAEAEAEAEAPPPNPPAAARWSQAPRIVRARPSGLKDRGR